MNTEYFPTPWLISGKYNDHFSSRLSSKQSKSVYFIAGNNKQLSKTQINFINRYTAYTYRENTIIVA